MPIQYDDLALPGDGKSLLDPKEIFAALPNKERKFAYLRDVQGEVLTTWFERRAEQDIVIKMNTGGGKTTVGLLCLQSCLNEGVGPALYLTPDEYLSAQVRQEAMALGIKIATDERDPAFVSGEAIFVTNVKKLINGKSVFGVKPNGIRIPLGSILIDDAHACLALAEEQFTVRVDATEPQYKQLLDLFSDDLRQQCEAQLLDLQNGAPGVIMQVPYWSWQNKISQLHQILQPLTDHEKLQFTYRLVKADLSLCRAVFGRRYIEISPRVLPIDAIPAFRAARRHIYMTATLADDSILVSDFSADPQSVSRPISPKSASDIGDRMILIPQEANPTISDESIREVIVAFSQQYNTVVLVPSNKAAEVWRPWAAEILTAENIHAGVERLRKGKVGLVVLVNKYDGVDLPGDACRILVIDGIPDPRRLIDQYDEAALSGSPLVKARRVQKIEQGMGRGVRSADDHCVVVLMGAGTINHLYPVADRKVSPATKVQFDLWKRLKDQKPPGSSAANILDDANACLGQDPRWVQMMKLTLARVKSESASTINPIAILQREAFQLSQIGQHRQAVQKMQSAVNLTTDRKLQGWLKQQLAEVTHAVDQTGAQTIQSTAVQLNSSLLKPLEGITYRRISSNSAQGIRAHAFLNERYSNANDTIIGLNALADDLVFQPELHKTFEEAFRLLGLHLGFEAQRPEFEFGRGPDELWALGGHNFFVTECKSEATTDRISKDDCNQLNGSIIWFLDTYGKDATLTALMVHPSYTFNYECAPNPLIRIIDSERLPQLQRAVRGYASSLSSGNTFNEPALLANVLRDCKLTAEQFVGQYSREFRRKQ